MKSANVTVIAFKNPQINLIFKIVTILNALFKILLVLGELVPTLHWKFNEKSADGFVEEANSTIFNRGYALPGTKIERRGHWIVANFKGNRSGILIDNATNTCFLSPQNCQAGLSVSFHVKWRTNLTNAKNGSLISSGNFSIYHENGRDLIVSLWNGSNEWQLRYTRNTTIVGWACYIVTWNRHALRLFINGSLKKEVSTNNTQNFAMRNGIFNERSAFLLGEAMPRRIAIGNVARKNFSKCGLRMMLDDLKIWDFALRSNETKKACIRGMV